MSDENMIVVCYDIDWPDASDEFRTEHETVWLRNVVPDNLNLDCLTTILLHNFGEHPGGFSYLGSTFDAMEESRSKRQERRLRLRKSRLAKRST